MDTQPTPEFGFLSEEAFVCRLHLEQRRTERSRRPFVFMLLESSLLMARRKNESRQTILEALASSVRETDIRGWYEDGLKIGLIFTEIGKDSGHAVGEHLSRKILGVLETHLGSDISKVHLSFFVFPEDWDKNSEATPGLLYADSARRRRAAQALKRVLDVGGSLAAIAVASPVFVLIGAAVKLTSPGPIFFRQERVGQYGQRFSFLKFRSMHVNSNHAIHREYVQDYINGTGKPQSTVDGTAKTVFKLTADPRITPLGKFLRRTSLDEIPQFFNVLMGDMSLVGPRPPIPYEVESYDIWHRRRLLGVKPGITGLWQVNGRSRTTFDEMVRLDLQYAKSWSVWMDLKILLRTPRAVLAGDGAY